MNPKKFQSSLFYIIKQVMSTQKFHCKKETYIFFLQCTLNLKLPTPQAHKHTTRKQKSDADQKQHYKYVALRFESAIRYCCEITVDEHTQLRFFVLLKVYAQG